MGAKKRRHNKFVGQHPVCCFCGGKTPTETIDHVPSIQLFYAKQRPSGLEFPACLSCNSATSKAEQIVAAFSRLYPDPAPGQEAEEQQTVIEHAFNNAPGLIHEVQPSARQQRNFLKARNIPATAFPPSEVPILNADGPILSAAFQTFGLKLFCGLHYEHAKRIIPPDGGVAMRLFTNIDLFEKRIPTELLNYLGPAKTLKQGEKEVGNQFWYNFAVGEEGGIGCYAAFFRQSFMLMGFVFFNIERFPVIEGMTPHRPRKPMAQSA